MVDKLQLTRTSVQYVTHSGAFRSELDVYRRAQTRGRESNRLLANLLNNIADAVIVIDAQQRILRFNRGAEEILGYSSGELTGQSLSILFPSELAARHQKHVENFARTGATGRQMGEYMRLTTYRKNGEEFPVEASIAKFGSGRNLVMMVILRDVTESRQSEEELIQRANLLDRISDAVIIIDSQQNILRFNRGAEEILGYSSGELTGQSLSILFPPEIAARHQQHVENFARTGATGRQMGEAMRLTAYRKNGEIFPVEATISKSGTGKDAIMMVILRDVTESRRREEELIQRANLLDRISDAVIVIDNDQRILRFNRGAEEIFGYATDEVIYQSLNILFPPEIAARHQQHVENFARTGATGRQMGEAMRLTAYRKNGEIFPVEATISKSGTGKDAIMMVILRDVTESRRREEELIQRANLLDRVADAIISMDMAFKILTWNRGAERIYGWRSEEVIGKLAADVLRPEYPNGETREQRLKIFEAQKHWEGDVVQVHKSGIPIYIYSSVTLIEDDTGQAIGTVAVNVDFTQRRMLEQELREALAKEKELGELKTRFTSTVSHEFRTPLAVILSSAEMLEQYSEKLTPERRHEHLRKIIRQTQHMRELLDDVLFISRASSQHAPFNPNIMNLEQFCRGVFNQYLTNKPANINLEFIAEGDFGGALMDERLILQIADNLLSNAVKYSPDGGMVRFDLRREGEIAVLRISDEGIGIPSDSLAELFQPFFRASNVRTISGTGLGLAIVKSSVDLHRGHINVESVVGQGTAFIVRLPFHQFKTL